MAILNTHADALVLAVICAILLILSFVGGLKTVRRSFVAAAAILALSAILIATAKMAPVMSLWWPMPVALWTTPP
jgi:hypothetical protein